MLPLLCATVFFRIEFSSKVHFRGVVIGYHLVYLSWSALLCSVLVHLGQTVVWSWGLRLKDSTQGGVGQVICRGVYELQEVGAFGTSSMSSRLHMLLM